MHPILSWRDKVDTEDTNVDCSQSIASKKRKSSEMEADGQMSAKRHKSMIETNQQFGAGRVELEKEKNPQQEIRQSYQLERVNQHKMNNEMGEEKTISFKNRLYTIRYQPENGNEMI